MLLGSLLNARMPPKKSVPKVGKGCETTEVTLPRVVPNMLSTRVKPSLPSLSNIFSATKMKPFSTPYARKSCDQSRHGVKVVKRNGGKVAKRSFISGSESESELDSVVGGEEASIKTEVDGIEFMYPGKIFHFRPSSSLWGLASCLSPLTIGPCPTSSILWYGSSGSYTRVRSFRSVW